MVKFFQRKKDVVTDIPELERYYAQRRSRNGLGWVLALATLVITAVAAVAIFYAGRWVFDRFGDDQTAQTTTVNSDQQAQVEAPTIDGSLSDPNANRSANQPSTTPPTTTPATGDSAPAPLPRTGDGPEQ